MADPLTAGPRRRGPSSRSSPSRPPARSGCRAAGATFRRLYAAVAASELGDALHQIASMWTALTVGGPLGVIAVRLADSVPALVFGLHGGAMAGPAVTVTAPPLGLAEAGMAVRRETVPGGSEVPHQGR